MRFLLFARFVPLNLKIHRLRVCIVYFCTHRVCIINHDTRYKIYDTRCFRDYPGLDNFECIECYCRVDKEYYLYNM